MMDTIHRTEAVDDPVYLSVLVGTESGLDELPVAVTHPDEDGIPTTIPEDAEYVFLTSELATAFAHRKFIVRRAEAAGHLGPFAIMFDETLSRPEVTLFSVNRERHKESIENLARTRE